MAMTLSNDNMINITDLPQYIKGAKDTRGLIKDCINLDNIPKLEEVERLLIEKSLEKYKSFRAAAEVLGINHKTVAAKARKYNIIAK